MMRQCPNCRGLFRPTSESGPVQQVYCSHNCRASMRQRAKADRRKERGRPVVGVPAKPRSSVQRVRIGDEE